MAWGLWDLRPQGVPQIHIIPADEEGVMKPGHELTPECPCGPEMDDDPQNGCDIWVHKEAQ